MAAGKENISKSFHFMVIAKNFLPWQGCSSFKVRTTWRLQGWRDRFGTTNANEDEDGGNGSDLLCTAEVAAAVMDRCGDKECADVIRSRLDVFQSTFS